MNPLIFIGIGFLWLSLFIVWMLTWYRMHEFFKTRQKQDETTKQLNHLYLANFIISIIVVFFTIMFVIYILWSMKRIFYWIRLQENISDLYKMGKTLIPMIKKEII